MGGTSFAESAAPRKGGVICCAGYAAPAVRRYVAELLYHERRLLRHRTQFPFGLSS